MGGGQQKAMGRGRGEAPAEGPEQARNSFPAQTHLQRRGREPGPTPRARSLKDTHARTRSHSRTVARRLLHVHTRTCAHSRTGTQACTHTLRESERSEGPPALSLPLDQAGWGPGLWEGL